MSTLLNIIMYIAIVYAVLFAMVVLIVGYCSWQQKGLFKQCLKNQNVLRRGE